MATYASYTRARATADPNAVDSNTVDPNAVDPNAAATDQTAAAPYVPAPMTYGTPAPTTPASNWTSGGTGGGAANPFGGSNGGRDVYNQYQNLGQYGFNQGQQLQNYYGGQANTAASGLGQANQNSNDVLANIRNGGGGYTPEMQNNILQNSGAVSNNVGALTNQQIQNAAGYGKNFVDLSNAINGNLQQPIASAGQNAFGQIGAGLQTIGNAGALAGQQAGSAISGANQSISGALGNAGQGVGAAMSDTGLNVTPQYLNQAYMSDQEVANRANQNALAVGSQYRGAEDQVMQAALASGQGTPGQLAAAQMALQGQAAPQVSEAMTAGNIAARNQQMQQAQNIQGTQLQAGQYRAGLGTQAALALGQMGVGAGEYSGQLGAQTALGLGQMGIGAGEYQGQIGANTALGLGQMGENAAQYGGGLQMNAAQNAANMSQSALQQGVNNTLQNQGQQSNIYQASYAPWVSQQNQLLPASQNAQNIWGGQLNAANSGMSNAYNQTYNTGLNAAGGYSAYGNSAQGQGAGGLFTNALTSSAGNFIGSGAGISQSKNSNGTGWGMFAEGGMIDSPQLIQVGEHSRPEVILPLQPATHPSDQNDFERMGAELGRKMGIPQKPDPRIAAENDKTNQLSRLPRYQTGGIVNPAGGGMMQQQQPMVGGPMSSSPSMPSMMGGSMQQMPSPQTPMMQTAPMNYQPTMPSMQSSEDPMGQAPVGPTPQQLQQSLQYQPAQIPKAYARGGIVGISTSGIQPTHMPHMMGGKMPRVSVTMSKIGGGMKMPHASISKPHMHIPKLRPPRYAINIGKPTAVSELGQGGADFSADPQVGM